MIIRTHKQPVIKILVMLALVLLALGLVQKNAAAATLPLETCTRTDVSTVTCDLWATTGSTTLPDGTTIAIWGYSNAAGTITTPGGPALIVNQDDTVTINLTNNVPETTGLLIQGQTMTPDTTGVASGLSKSYTFIASAPGTFLYEAGLLANAQHQVAMGLYGALIVRPSGAPGQAYADASTAFVDEGLLVLSEIDPALNTSADPTLFDMRNYNPKYFLINGKAYPGTDPLTVSAGGNVLLRYVNAGLQAHAMSTLGVSQTIIGQDGSPYPYSHRVVAETIAPGQTLDTLVSIPATADVGSRFAIYDANMLLRNNKASSFGGMLSFLTVSITPPPGSDITGPAVTAISLSPNPTNGSVDVTVDATISDASTGGSTVSAAEFYIDSTANVSNTLIAVDAAFDSVTEVVAGTIPSSTLGILSSGTHTIFVRGQDILGNWGAFRPVTLNLDKTGPSTIGLGLTPNPSSGAEPVALSATGDDTASGGSNIIAAEYWVDGGSSIPMDIVAGADSAVRSFTATIPAGLAMGPHTVSVRSQDALGNWGAAATITLQVADTAAPITSNVSASPNPNNGYQGYNTSVQAVRVFADFSDTTTGGSNIAAAEGFIDIVGTTGTGFVFVATDGSFNSPTESGYSDVPLVVISALSNGDHTIYVHAKDAAGNWGDMSTTILTIQKWLYLSTVGSTNPPGVSGTADDSDILLWNGTAYSRLVDATTIGIPSNANVDGFDRVDDTHFYLSFSGDTTITGLGSVQDEDIVYYSAGIWSVYFDGTAAGLTAANQDIDAFNIVGSTIYFSTSGNTNPPGVTGTADDADIYTWNGSTFARVLDASATPYSLASGANVDGVVWVDPLHFYLSFTSDTALPGFGTVQDEDVVFYNNGSWVVYFDGTAHGLTSNNLDIDAFDIP